MNRCARCGRPTTARLCGRCQPTTASAPSPFAPPTPGSVRPGSPPTPSPGPFPQPPARLGRTAPPVGISAAPVPSAGTGWLLRDDVGTVAATPTTTVGRPSLEGRLGRLALALFAAVVLTNAAMMSVLVVWLLVGVLVLWGLSRLGLLASMGFLLALGQGRGGRQRWEPPTLSFRCQFGGRARDVRVRGFDTGVQLGDQVEVSGPTIAGVVHATRVVNRTNGAVLRRHGLVRAVVLSLLCLWLLLVLISQLAAS